MLPPAARLIGAQLDRYVGDQLYWVLHAPRQTGKTTFLFEHVRELNATGKVAACYIDVETADGADAAARGIPTICEAIKIWATRQTRPPSLAAKKDPPERAVHSLGQLVIIASPNGKCCQVFRAQIA
jgi:hypothetical protein